MFEMQNIGSGNLNADIFFFCVFVMYANVFLFLNELISKEKSKAIYPNLHHD